MVVTATKFKANIGHYLDSVPNEEIYITKNGRIAARLSYNMEDKLSVLNSLVGILPKDQYINLEELKTERILRRTFPEFRNDDGALKNAAAAMLTKLDNE